MKESAPRMKRWTNFMMMAGAFIHSAWAWPFQMAAQNLLFFSAHRFKVLWIKSKECFFSVPISYISYHGLQPWTAIFVPFCFSFSFTTKIPEIWQLFDVRREKKIPKEKNVWIIWWHWLVWAERHKGYFSWKHFLVAIKFVVAQTMAGYIGYFFLPFAVPPTRWTIARRIIGIPDFWNI